MNTVIIWLFVVGILCLLIALDGLRRLLSLLPEIQRGSARNQRKTAIIGATEIMIALALISASFFVFLTQPIFGPSVLSTRARVGEYLKTIEPPIEMTGFAMSKSLSNESAYAVRAGSSAQTLDLVVTLGTETKAIIDIHKTNP